MFLMFKSIQSLGSVGSIKRNTRACSPKPLRKSISASCALDTASSGFFTSTNRAIPGFFEPVGVAKRKRSGMPERLPRSGAKWRLRTACSLSGPSTANKACKASGAGNAKWCALSRVRFWSTTSEIIAGVRRHKFFASAPNANPTARQRVELKRVPEKEYPGKWRARQRLRTTVSGTAIKSLMPLGSTR